MELSEPLKYEITVENFTNYSVKGPNGTKTFKAPVTTSGPKLYVFSNKNNIIYIGQTIQGMSARLRLGFKADGTGGYWGYKWRNELKKADLYIWTLIETPKENELYTLESIESEVVYHFRSQKNQWPKYQTEIHFHETNEKHRKMAIDIYNSELV